MCVIKIFSLSVLGIRMSVLCENFIKGKLLESIFSNRFVIFRMNILLEKKDSK